MKRFQHPPVTLLVAFIAWQTFCFLIPTFSWAELVQTQSVIAAQEPPSAEPRKRIYSVLKRKGVERKLEQFGLSRDEALTRINSLTDEEIAHLAKQIEAYGGPESSESNENSLISGGDDTEEAISYSVILVLGIAIAGCLAICPFFLFN